MLPVSAVFVFALTVVAVINFCRWMCQNEAHSRPERYSMTPSRRELLFRKIDLSETLNDGSKFSLKGRNHLFN
jgi:hypothetical protein